MATEKTTREIGFAAESVACRHLQKQGLTLKERNFSCKMGEIDLIMQDKDSLVFVEVRKRSRQDYGSGAETVNHAKQRKILKTAQYYLMTKQLEGKTPCRIDVVDINGQNHIQWFPNAILERW